MFYSDVHFLVLLTMADDDNHFKHLEGIINEENGVLKIAN